MGTTTMNNNGQQVEALELELAQFKTHIEGNLQIIRRKATTALATNASFLAQMEYFSPDEFEDILNRLLEAEKITNQKAVDIVETQTAINSNRELVITTGDTGDTTTLTQQEGMIRIVNFLTTQAMLSAHQMMEELVHTNTIMRMLASGDGVDYFGEHIEGVREAFNTLFSVFDGDFDVDDPTTFDAEILAVG